ncbi:MAG: hypothetical protein GY754_46175 [bacterium]|nr:hypothetical protein [bacterium]
MTIDELFAILAAAASKPGTTEDDVYDSLEAAGIDPVKIDRLIKFTQLAWGRIFLKDKGILFIDQYYGFGANGDIIESGKLSEETYFAYATKNVDTYMGSAAFKLLALTSAEVHSANKAMNKGKKAKDLLPVEAFMFLEDPDTKGMRKAREFMKKQMELLQTQKGGVH